MDLEGQLQQVQTRLEQLQAGAENLRQHLAGRNVPKLETNARRLVDRCRAARVELETPTLRIATFGTTSSGKSTVTNVLAGQPVAPMDPKELSAGVLRLIPGAEVSITIEETPPETWAHGHWKDVSVDDVRRRAEEVMRRFLSLRERDSNLLAPRLTVTLPMLLDQRREQLGLPRGVRLELLDLPGLNHANDRKNLEIVQKHVSRAFGVVVLDFSHTDRESLKTLLGELKKTVSDFNGSPDAMVFLCNRVDRLTALDRPLGDYLAEFTDELQRALGLDAPPPVIPTVSHVCLQSLMIAGSGASAVPRRLLRGLRKDAAALAADDKSIKRHWRALEDILDQDSDEGDVMLPDELVQHLGEWAWAKTGYAAAFDALRARFEARYGDLIIVPVVTGLLKMADALATHAADAARVGRLRSRQQLDDESKRLTLAAARVRECLFRSRDTFRDDFVAVSRALKDQQAAGLDLAEVKLKGVGPLFDTTKEVKDALLSEIVRPVTKGLEGGSRWSTVCVGLQTLLPPRELGDLGNAYETLQKSLPNLAAGGDHITLEEFDTGEGKKALDDKQRHHLKFYAAMRSSMSTYSDRFLQARSKVLVDAVREVLTLRVEAALDESERENPELFGAAGTGDLVGVRKQLAEGLDELPIKPPEKLFELSSPQRPVKGQTRVKDGVEDYRQTYEEEYTTGTCWKSRHTRTNIRTETRDRYVNKPTVRLTLSAPPQMRRDFENGIDKGLESVWLCLQGWFTNLMDQASVLMHQAVTTTYQAAEEVVAARLSELEASHEAEQKHWGDIEAAGIEVERERTRLQVVASRAT